MIVIRILALLGFIDTVLIAIGQLTGTSVCLMGSGGCDAVLSSPYSTIFGIPLGTIGIGFYCIILWLAAQTKESQTKYDYVKTIIFLSLLGSVVYLGLIGIQGLILHAWCSNCLFSAFVTFSLFLLSVYYHRRHKLRMRPFFPLNLPHAYGTMALIFILPTGIYFLHNTLSINPEGDPDSQIVLSMDDREVTRQALKYSSRYLLREAEIEIYKRNKEWLENMLLEREAKERSITRNELTKISLTEEELEEAYKDISNEISSDPELLKESKKNIAIDLWTSKTKDKRETLLDSLIEKYHVQIDLPEPTLIEIPTRDGEPHPDKIHIVVFSDFACPHCRAAHFGLKEIIKPFENAVFLEIRHLCLLPPQKKEAISAAFCARNQGQYEEYVDYNFEHQDNLNREILLEHAKTLGMDLDAFEDCLISDKTQAYLDEDRHLFRDLGLGGIPAIFVNDFQWQIGWADYGEKLRKFLTSEVEELNNQE